MTSRISPLKRINLFAVSAGLLGSLAILSGARAAPQPISPQERVWPYSLYSADAYQACKSVNDARVARGLPQLVESTALAEAGRHLLDHMLREDWVGATFPSGYSVSTALTEAGYPATATTAAVFRVSPVTDFKGYFGSPYYKTSAARACSPLNGLNPALTAFGYFSIQPKSDPGRVDTNTSENGGGYYEIMLFGSEAPTSGGRLLVNFYHVRNRYNLSPAAPTANIVSTRGFRIDRSIVGTPAAHFISGKARIRGRLPKGVKFNEREARFYGTPRKRGSFRVKVTARYRARKDFMTAGTDGGLKTITVALRIK